MRQLPVAFLRALSLAFILLYDVSAFAQNWPEATVSTRPGSRWWWLGSAVDADNLAYNIKEYAKAGLGTLEITPIYGVRNNENNDINYLSPEWMRMYGIAQREAEANGMRIEMNNGTGWPFGGPEVTPDMAAKKAVFKRVLGNNGTDSIILTIGNTLQKVKRAAPGGEGLVIDHLDAGVVKDYLNKFDKAFSESGVSYPPVFFNDSYEVYGADWTPSLLSEFHKRRGYRLENYFPEFTDTARNETTRRIVADYRRTMSELLLDNFLYPWTEWAHSHGALTRNQAHGSPANLIDAYAAVDIPECEGFGLSDFGITGLRKDSISKRNDSDISMLKYASSAANITGKRLVSSETFTWLTDHFRTSLSQCKPDMDLMFLGGVNHMFFHGTPYSPKEAKWPGWLFYASINMSPSNPIWGDAPAFFDYITRCQSFLQEGSPDNDFLLYLPIEDIWDELSGRMVAFDIHKMHLRAPGFIKTVNTIVNSGYNVDYISDNLLGNVKPDGGKLATEGGLKYAALVVPDARLMPVETLRKILDLAGKGCMVVFVGGLPEDVPGFYDLEGRRKEFSQLVSTVSPGEGKIPYGDGFIIVSDDYSRALSQTGVQSEQLKSRQGLSYLRRAFPNGHIYFISNLQPEDVDTCISINNLGETNMFFNPMNGKRGVAGLKETAEGKMLRIQLKSGESVILQTFDKVIDETKLPGWNYYEELPGVVALDSGWNLRFTESVPEIPGEYEIGAPKSWTGLDIPVASVNMGRGLYSVEFRLPEVECDDWVLDLGDVRESARVRINGKDVATLWAVPFRTMVGEYLHNGNNKIEVEVTNLPANRISEMDRNGEEWRIFKDANIARLGGYKGDFSSWGPVASGLNGEVRLIPVSY